MKTAKKVLGFLTSPLFVMLCIFGLSVSQMRATDDDITTVVTAVSGYWTAIKAVAIGVILFVIGRRVLRKL